MGCEHALILPGHLPHYRVGFINALAQQNQWRVTVAHSGQPTNPALCRFNERIVPLKTWGPLNWQSGVKDLALSAKYVIAMFDPRWLSSMLLLRSPRPYKLILWGHGFGRSPKAILLRPLRVWLARKAEAVVVYDEQSREEFVRFGYLPSRVFVAPNTLAVENAGFNPSVPRTGFIFAGRLQKRKSLPDLIQAFSKATEQVEPGLGLEIIGGGALLPELRAMVQHYGLENRVTFHGEILDAQRLKVLFQRSLAYVSPGAVGLGVLHSFAYGVPVVTARRSAHGPEVTNLIEGQNALFYDGSPENLTPLLVKLAKEREVSYRLGENAFRFFMTQRTISHMVEGFKRAAAN